MKQILVVALLATLAPLSQAQSQVAVSVSTPHFGFTIGAPFFGFGPPVMVGPVYAPPIYAPPVFAPVPVYARFPAYAPVRVRAPRVYAPRIYAPRIYTPRIHAPIYAPVPAYRPAPRVIYVPTSAHPRYHGRPRPTPDYAPFPSQGASHRAPQHAPQGPGWLPPGHARGQPVAIGNVTYRGER